MKEVYPLKFNQDYQTLCQRLDLLSEIVAKETDTTKYNYIVGELSDISYTLWNLNSLSYMDEHARNPNQLLFKCVNSYCHNKTIKEHTVCFECSQMGNKGA